MKLMKNDHRSQMNISTLAKAMFISILGSKVADFNPEEYIESWPQSAKHLWRLEKSFDYLPAFATECSFVSKYSENTILYN